MNCKRCLFLIVIYLFSFRVSNAQMPSAVKTKGAKTDTILIYNPYYPVFETSMDGKDTFRACPENEIISFEDEFKFAANDCTIIDENIFSWTPAPTPRTQMYKYIEHAKKDLSDPLTPAMIHGIVVAEFNLEKNGKVSGVSIHRSLSPARDQQAIKILERMPNWMERPEGFSRFRYRMLLRF